MRTKLIVSVPSFLPSSLRKKSRGAQLGNFAATGTLGSRNVQILAQPQATKKRDTNYYHNYLYYYCSCSRAVTWDGVSAAMSASWSPLGRSSPPPSSVHYGNVWKQKSSAGSLCGGREQCDSCTARGHMAATATQGKENIRITAISKIGRKSVSN